MSGGLTPESLMAKAVRACTSARALLESGAPVQPDIGRTHSGLITAFGLHLVKAGPVSRELGRLLKRAEEIRRVADYKGDSVELDDAREMVEQAEVFVGAMRDHFKL